MYLSDYFAHIVWRRLTQQGSDVDARLDVTMAKHIHFLDHRHSPMAPRRKSAAQTARKRRPPSNQQQPSATPPQPAASSNGTGAWSPASAPIDYNLLLNDPIWFESSSYANVPSSSGAPPPEHALVGLGEAEAGASPAAPLEAQAGQLVRRNPDSHLMRRPIDPWEAPAEQDALIAPPESPASRKPIPPFVQKLCR